MILTSLLIFSGCSSEVGTKNINLEENLKKAEDYYANGQYEDSLKIYDNLYAKTNDTKYLDEMDKIKVEQKTLNVVIEFRSLLTDIIDNKVRKGIDINVHDLKIVTEDLIEKMDEFDNLEVPENHIAYDYINSIKGSDSYLYLNNFTNNEYNNFLSEPLDPISDTGEFANTLVISIFRDDIYGEYIPDILSIELPEQLTNEEQI